MLEDLGETIETIPYEVALVGKRELTEDEIEYGKELESLALEYLKAKPRKGSDLL